MKLLKIDNLSFSYDKKILDNINFNFYQKNFVSILGINGSGKSTLIKNILHLLKPSSGYVYIEDINLINMSNRKRAQSMSYVSQQSQISKITVFDYILLGRKPYINIRATKVDYEITEFVIKELNLEKFSFKYIETLSGGELQKISIARALVQDPKILILDEPTSNLDLKNQIEVLEIIAKYTEEKNICSIIAIHDINLALRYSNNFILLKEGKIYKSGGPEIITEESIKEVYGVNIEIKRFNNQKYIIIK